jgi:hypothetical protein
MILIPASPFLYSENVTDSIRVLNGFEQSLSVMECVGGHVITIFFTPFRALPPTNRSHEGGNTGVTPQVTK